MSNNGTGLITCPGCGKVLSFSSYFGAYICDDCGYERVKNRNLPEVGLFEKVSYDQFYTSMKDEFGERFSEEEIKGMYEKIKKPRRATKKSAGNDIFAPFDFNLLPDETITIPTGLRVHIDDGWFLGCYPRSGLGFKYFASLANTVGIIDGDYVNAKNEGHIWVRIVNRTPPPIASNGGPSMVVKQGEGFAQGIFQPFGITRDDDATGERTGGFGSTTRQ